MTKNSQLTIIYFVASLLLLVLLAFVMPQNALAAYTCSSDSQCGNNGFVGEQFCQGNSLFGNYVTYTCNNPGTNYSNCTSNKSPQLVRTCNSDQVCKAGIWFIGCQSANGSDTGSGGNYYGSYPNNSYNYGNNYGSNYGSNNPNYDYLRCEGNTVFWYDRYGAKKSIYQQCSTNQICQNDACVVKTCVSHTSKGCVDGSVYWYDSCGNKQEVLQTCGGIANCLNGECTSAATPAPAPTPKPIISYITVKQKENLGLTIFAKRDNETEIKKEITVASGETLHFVMTIKNTSDKSLPQVKVKAILPNSISYMANLKINGTESGDNLLDGIDLGQMDKGASKIISFDGVVLSPNAQTGIKVAGSVASGAITDSDEMTVNIETAKVVSQAPKTSGSAAALSNTSLTDFLKKWYIWGILLLVLIFLFVIIFRRLSSNN